MEGMAGVGGGDLPPPPQAVTSRGKNAQQLPDDRYFGKAHVLRSL